MLPKLDKDMEARNAPSSSISKAKSLSKILEATRGALGIESTKRSAKINLADFIGDDIDDVDEDVGVESFGGDDIDYSVMGEEPDNDTHEDNDSDSF